MLRTTFIAGAVLMAAGLLTCLSQQSPAAPRGFDATKEQIARALHSLEHALARGDSATEIAKMLYADDDVLTGEGEPGSTRGMADTIKDVQGWMDSLGPGGTKGCKYRIVDPVVSSATTFSSFLLLRCKANPPVLKTDQELRMMYVWKKFPEGWRVVLEMYASGSM
jgi:ketosteroid isomerase-like protein